VDHPRFIELREEEVKGIPLKQPCNLSIILLKQIIINGGDFTSQNLEV
jgi:hypothetical protein